MNPVRSLARELSKPAVGDLGRATSNGMKKKAAIIILTALCGIWFWFVMHAWVGSEIKFALVSAWAMPLFALVILAAIEAVAILVLTDFLWAWGIAWILGIEFVAIFGFTGLNVIAAALLIGLSAYAVKLIHIEARDRTKLHTFLILRRGLTWVILPLLITLSFAYYQTPLILERAKQGITSPTLNQFISTTAETFLKSQGEKLTEQQKAEMQKQLMQRELAGLSGIGQRYSAYLPPLLAFGLFLILWGIEFILVYLSVFLVMLLFWILRRTNFVMIELVDVKSEFIKL